LDKKQVVARGVVEGAGMHVEEARVQIDDQVGAGEGGAKKAAAVGGHAHDVGAHAQRHGGQVGKFLL
jgi:hypothetical protein